MVRKRLGPKTFKEAVSRMSLCHNVEIVPVSTNVNKKQSELFDKNSSSTGSGLFYELMTKGFFGGELHQRRNILKRGEPVSTIVDVLDSKKERIGEVKARYFGGGFPLIDDQVEKYKAIQRTLETYSVYFALYAYELGSLRKYKGNEARLFQELADKTLCSVIFPLSLAIQFHECVDESLVSRQDIEPGHDKQYTKRDEHLTKILSTTMGRLFYRPESIIERLELKPKDYKVERFCSPEYFFIEGSRVEKFPVLIISHNDYKAWCTKFSSEDSS